MKRYYQTAVFLFFAIAFVLTSSNSAKASMDLDSFSGLSTDINSFGALFHVYVPFTKSGYTFWDYQAHKNTDWATTGDYTVIFYSANAQYILGGGAATETVWATTSQNKAYCMNHDGASGDNYVYDCTGFQNCNNPNFCDSGDKLIALEATNMYSSQNTQFLQECTNAESIQTTAYTDPSEYYQCGSWDSGCSPVSATSAACTSTSGGGATLASSCTFSFASIPGWTDPLGMFTGFFGQLFSWFGCGIDAVINSVQSFFFTMFDNISGLFDSLKASFASNFDSITSEISTTISSVFIPSTGFMDAQVATFSEFKDEKFPIFAQLSDTFSNGFDNVSSGATSIPDLKISLFGANNLQIMDKTVLAPYIAGFRDWVSMFLWFYCAIFCFRSIHAFFHPGQMKLNM